MSKRYAAQVRKRLLGDHFSYTKRTVSPRQARDTRRGSSSQKENVVCGVVQEAKMRAHTAEWSKMAIRAVRELRCEKRHLFLSAFPMFVPSLSWQNVRFYI
jgi:hypothetical protein|eukprot:COSAG06_NODE_2912_length_6101_cov_280.856215_4_plen_101_part_00